MFGQFSGTHRHAAMDRKTRYTLFLIGSLTLGLAPFTPMPHLFEKFGMLFAGELTQPVDMFDLLIHGTFPALLIIEGARHVLQRWRSDP